MKTEKKSEKLKLAEKINLKWYNLVENFRGKRLNYPLTMKEQILISQDFVIDTNSLDNIPRQLLRNYWNEIKNI